MLLVVAVIAHKCCCCAEELAYGLIFITADAALLSGLKQRGSKGWCILDSDPRKLAQHLTYLTSTKVLSSSTIKALQACFACSQVEHWVFSVPRL